MGCRSLLWLGLVGLSNPGLAFAQDDSESDAPSADSSNEGSPNDESNEESGGDDAPTADEGATDDTQPSPSESSENSEAATDGEPAADPSNPFAAPGESEDLKSTRRKTKKKKKKAKEEAAPVAVEATESVEASEDAGAPEDAGSANPFATPGADDSLKSAIDDARVRTPDERGPAKGNVPAGLRIASYGATSGVDVGQALIIGANAGTAQTTTRIRFAEGKFGGAIGLPFVSHRLPRQPRQTGLGNLQLDLWYALNESDTGWSGVGVELHTHISPNSRAYTWVHDADEVWPSTGIDLVYQNRKTNGNITRLLRGTVGYRRAWEADPWASSYLTVEAAIGADVALGEYIPLGKYGDRIGAVGEVVVSYWDQSPIDLTGMIRADVADGLRLRGGMVIPFGVWVGATAMPSEYRGVREATLLMDLSFSL